MDRGARADAAGLVDDALDQGARVRAAAGRTGGRVHLIDEQHAGPARRPHGLGEHQHGRFLQVEAASEVDGGRRRVHVVEPERQQRDPLGAQGVHHPGRAGRLAGARPPGEDAFAGRALQPRRELRRRRPGNQPAPNEAPAGAVQVALRRRRRQVAGALGVAQAAGPEPAPGEPLDESPAGQRALRGALRHGQELRDDRAGVGGEERLHAPTHLLFEGRLADGPHVDPAEPVHGSRGVADPAAEESREPLPAEPGGQPVPLERLRRFRAARRRTGFGELPRVTAGHQHEAVAVARQAVADRLQQTPRAGVERGRIPRAGGMFALRVVDLPPRVRRHDQRGAPGVERLDAQGAGGPVEQAEALGQRPPVLVAGRVGGGSFGFRHGAGRRRGIRSGYTGSRPPDPASTVSSAP